MLSVHFKIAWKFLSINESWQTRTQHIRKVCSKFADSMYKQNKGVFFFSLIVTGGKCFVIACTVTVYINFYGRMDGRSGFNNAIKLT